MFVVLKFGGTSVATRARWTAIAQQVQRCIQDGERPVVVCSAVSGVSDLLQELLDAAANGEASDLPEQVAARHLALARDLNVSHTLVDDELELLRRLALGASLLGEVGPRVRARVMALGERMSTILGAAFLRDQGVPITWIDARTVLTAVDEPGLPAARRWLSATVDHTADPALQQRFCEFEAVLTQGFIARGPHGDTVLLGRGGSDTSATSLSAKLQADRCEIWTDVPGMFTANPRVIAGARLLVALDYDEAQEIASTGAKVLHPRCIAPVRDASIPLHIRCTQAPQMPGTVIGDSGEVGGSQVKAISSRDDTVLVSMETVGMWQQVGFLANVFGVFRDQGLSIDNVSTSETNVTVTLDPGANPLDRSALERLEQALSPYCVATTITGCASVSLVGRGIRGILYKLAPALQLFEDHRVHLLTQAASDLNLTVVVDQDQAPRLVGKLHALLFGDQGGTGVFGPTWTELFDAKQSAALNQPPWWVSRRAELQALRQQTPVYVYNAPTLTQRAKSLVSLTSVDRVLYSIKANSNLSLLDVLAQTGVGFECVSVGEVALIRDRFPDATVLYTPNFADRDECAAALEHNIQLTLDNLHPLIHWPELFAGQDIFLRLDPGKGRGHHEKVRTAGRRSKFGIAPEQLEEAAKLADKAGATVVGLHAHAGSGVLDPTNWQEVALYLAEAATTWFSAVTVLDLGGGLGVPDRPGRPGLDLDGLDRALGRFKTAHPGFELWLEPGRFLVAEAGVLLLRVTQLKGKGNHVYVGVDGGMNTLLRPALYGAYHPIFNLDKLHESSAIVADVVGPICETGDVLGRSRRLPQCAEGDLMLVATAGAYGASMASTYNTRPLPNEHLLG